MSAKRPGSEVLRYLALAVPFLSVPLGISSSQLGWFGPSIQELSDRQNRVLNILIQPADYAFSVWGAVYLGVLGLALVQAFPPGSRNPRYAQARLPLVLNLAVNFGWFVATQRELGGVSAALLWAQFGTAVWLYVALEISKTRAYRLERVLRVSVSLYVGWLTVANVVMTAYVLERLGWSGWGVGDVTWTVVVLVAASAVGLFARAAWRDPAYGGAFVWALVGVAVKAGQPLAVSVTAAVLALVFLLSLFPGSGSLIRPNRRAAA